MLVVKCPLQHPIPFRRLEREERGVGRKSKGEKPVLSLSPHAEGVKTLQDLSHLIGEKINLAERDGVKTNQLCKHHS